MALTLFPIGAFSQSNEGGQYRIAVVDMSLLMAEYNKRKEKYDELQKSTGCRSKSMRCRSALKRPRKNMKRTGQT